jgi:AraC-like DNA-binding protein
MQINITSTIYLLAVVQAIILLFILGKKKDRSLADHYLMTILITLSVTLIHYVLVIDQLIPMSSPFFNVSAVSWLTISPLLYLYTRSLVNRQRQWRWKNLLYFPFSWYHLLQILLVTFGINVGFYLLFESTNSYNTAWILTYLFNSLVFSVASIHVLNNAKVSEKQRANLQWLAYFFKGFTVVLVLLISLLLWHLRIDYYFIRLEYFLLMFYAAFIFNLVIFALRSSTYWNNLSSDHYGHTQKDENELAHLHMQLTNFLREQPIYLHPKLTLSELSTATQIAENQLSQLFTQHLNTNFYRFINSYRLAAFQQQIAEKGTAQYTIMALAESAGFASKATFYKVFKEELKMTPTAYVKQLRRKAIS